MNFVRALRVSAMDYWIAGADYSKYYIELPDIDSRHLTPRHDSPDFVRKVAGIAKNEKVDFLHPQPSTEALVLSKARDQVPVPLLLPRSEVMETGQDKLLTKARIEQAGVPVAGTVALEELDDVEKAFSMFQAPLWVRARHGAGGGSACRAARRRRRFTGLRCGPAGELHSTSSSSRSTSQDGTLPWTPCGMMADW